MVFGNNSSAFCGLTINRVLYVTIDIVLSKREQYKFIVHIVTLFRISAHRLVSQSVLGLHFYQKYFQSNSAHCPKSNQIKERFWLSEDFWFLLWKSQFWSKLGQCVNLMYDCAQSDRKTHYIGYSQKRKCWFNGCHTIKIANNNLLVIGRFFRQVDFLYKFWK